MVLLPHQKSFLRFQGSRSMVSSGRIQRAPCLQCSNRPITAPRENVNPCLFPSPPVPIVFSISTGFAFFCDCGETFGEQKYIWFRFLKHIQWVCSERASSNTCLHCRLEVGGRYLYDTFSTLWAIISNIFTFDGEIRMAPLFCLSDAYKN